MFFEICPFLTMKICPIVYYFCQSRLTFLSIGKRPSTPPKTFIKFCQSGKFRPNWSHWRESWYVAHACWKPTTTVTNVAFVVGFHLSDTTESIPIMLHSFSLSLFSETIKLAIGGVNITQKPHQILTPNSFSVFITFFIHTLYLSFNLLSPQIWSRWRYLGREHWHPIT